MRKIIGIIFFLIFFVSSFSISVTKAGLENVPEEFRDAIARCARCHTFENIRSPRTGPSLFGVIDRPVGTLEDFRFSKYYTQIGQAGHKWTENDLFEYMANNKDFLVKKTGNPKAKGRMNYNTEDASIRKKIIEYLKTLK